MESPKPILEQRMIALSRRQMMSHYWLLYKKVKKIFFAKMLCDSDILPDSKIKREKLRPHSIINYIYSELNILFDQITLH